MNRLNSEQIICNTFYSMKKFDKHVAAKEYTPLRNNHSSVICLSLLTSFLCPFFFFLAFVLLECRFPSSFFVFLYPFLGLRVLLIVAFVYSRYGFPNPKQYTDNELNCGGFNVQWATNKGKCGVCGDPYHLNQNYVYPGKYANGIITKTYTKGQQITVLIEVTSNHRGFFTFRIGDIGKPPMTQQKLTHLLKQPNGATSWEIPKKSGNEVFSINLVLPQDLTCDQCVIQWWWKTGNSWGCDDTGCAVGKGKKQETFVNCADVRILSNGATGPPIEPPTEPPTGPPIEPPTGPPTRPPIEPPTEPSTRPPVITTSPPKPGGCIATGAWTGNANMDEWCRVNCAAGYCPSSMCKCSS